MNDKANYKQAAEFMDGMVALLDSVGIHFTEAPMELMVIGIVKGEIINGKQECAPFIMSTSGNTFAMMHAVKHAYHSIVHRLLLGADIECNEDSEIPMQMPSHTVPVDSDEDISRMYL